MLLDTFGLFVFMHNKDQMYVPKMDKIFGSEFIALQVDSARMKAKKSGTEYQIITVYNLAKTHWKALNTPHKRCRSENIEANTTKCIVQFLENRIGCSLGLAKSNSKDKR